MATKANLMGLGVNPIQAQRMATEPSTLVASGSTLASCVLAAAVGGTQYLVSVTSGTSGIAMPVIGTDNGALLGDDYIINNQSGASIVVFFPGGVNVSYGGATSTGTTGVSVAQHTSTAFYPLTTSSWLGIKGT